VCHSSRFMGQALLKYFPVIIWLAALQMTRNTRIHFSSSSREERITHRVGFNRLLMCDMFFASAKIKYFYMSAPRPRKSYFMGATVGF